MKLLPCGCKAYSVPNHEFLPLLLHKGETIVQYKEEGMCYWIKNDDHVTKIFVSEPFSSISTHSFEETCSFLTKIMESGETLYYGNLAFLTNEKPISVVCGK